LNAAYGEVLLSDEAFARRVEELFGGDSEDTGVLLALDWGGDCHELLIGRHSSCDLVVSDPSVSRRHARLVFRDHGWILQDLDSTNGTRVNGVRVGRSELRPGDRLAIGEARLTID
jgi:predicted component of type VI protein secretion system